MLGGNIRLTKRVALVSESWLFTSKRMKWGEQPFGLAIRIFGERLAADIGLLIIGKVIKEGGPPIPWISFAYNFGR